MPIETTSAATEASTDGDATSTTSTAADEAGTHLPPPPDTGTVRFWCDLLARDCLADEYCAPYDAAGAGAWSGSQCVPAPDAPAIAGDPCSMPLGPIAGQGGCGTGLVCASASAAATEGVCAPLCQIAGEPCADRLTCIACTGAGFTDFGVCVDEPACPRSGCAIAGCIRE